MRRGVDWLIPVDLRDSMWKGLRVEVPGDVFYESGTTWKGVVVGVVHKKSSAKKNAVYIKFDDDEKTYWFDKTKVIDWLTDKKLAEELRPTLINKKQRRSISESESSIGADVSQQSLDLPDGAGANGALGHLTPLGKVAEGANGSLEKTPERAAEVEVGLDSHPAGEGLEEENEKSILRTPSSSVVRRFGKWMTRKFRSERIEECLEEPGKEEVGPQVNNAETDEEMLDNDELKRLGAVPDNGTVLTPVRVHDSGWLTKMTGGFYTPFSSQRIRKRNISPMERPKRSSGKDNELNALSEKARQYRRAYEAEKLRFFESFPGGNPTPENIKRHYAHVGSEQQPVFSPAEDLDRGYEVDDEDNRMDISQQTTVQQSMTRWHPTHFIFAVAIVAAWASCVYYGRWIEDTETV